MLFKMYVDDNNHNQGQIPEANRGNPLTRRIYIVFALFAYIPIRLDAKSARALWLMQGLTACSLKLPRSLAASAFRHRIRRPLFFKLKETAWSNSSTTTADTEYSPELVIQFNQLQELRQSIV